MSNNTQSQNINIKFLVDKLEPVTQISLKKQYAIWILGTLAYLTLLLSTLGIRDDISLKLKLEDWHYVFEIISCFILIFLCGYYALKLSIPDRIKTKQILILPFMLITFIFIIFFTSKTFQLNAITSIMFSEHLMVSIKIILISLPSIAFSIYMVKKAAPTFLKINSYFIFLQAGILAHTVLRLHLCSNDINIIVLFCFLPALLIGVLSLFWAKKLLYW